MNEIVTFYLDNTDIELNGAMAHFKIKKNDFIIQLLNEDIWYNDYDNILFELALKDVKNFSNLLIKNDKHFMTIFQNFINKIAGANILKFITNDFLLYILSIKNEQHKRLVLFSISRHRSKLLLSFIQIIDLLNVKDLKYLFDLICEKFDLFDNVPTNQNLKLLLIKCFEKDQSLGFEFFIKTLYSSKFIEKQKRLSVTYQDLYDAIFNNITDISTIKIDCTDLYFKQAVTWNSVNKIVFIIKRYLLPYKNELKIHFDKLTEYYVNSAPTLHDVRGFRSKLLIVLDLFEFDKNIDIIKKHNIYHLKSMLKYKYPQHHNYMLAVTGLDFGDLEYINFFIESFKNKNITDNLPGLDDMLTTLEDRHESIFNSILEDNPSIIKYCARWFIPSYGCYKDDLMKHFIFLEESDKLRLVNKFISDKTIISTIESLPKSTKDEIDDFMLNVIIDERKNIQNPIRSILELFPKSYMVYYL